MADINGGRRNTASAWTSTNPILASGEVGFENNEEGNGIRFKIGDGSTDWIGLEWSSMDLVDLIIHLLEETNG